MEKLILIILEILCKYYGIESREGIETLRTMFRMPHNCLIFYCLSLDFFLWYFKTKCNIYFIYDFLCFTAYNKQHNLCVNLIGSEKKNFFSNINTSEITDNKTLRKTVKSFFTSKIKITFEIMLIQKKLSPRNFKRK